MLRDLEEAFLEYRKNHDIPMSVLDTLDLMLQKYVSGLSTPDPDDIPSTQIDPNDQDGKSLIAEATTTLTSEKELEDLIYQALRDVKTGVRFNVSAGWLDDDLLYDIVFNRIKGVYMIDAFGLHAYYYQYTQIGTIVYYSLDFEYFDNHTPEEIREMRQKVEEKAKEVVQDLQLAGKTDYEKIRAINDFLCDTVYYPDKPYILMDHNPYGTLIDGRAVCEGYARTCKILCDLAGMECHYVEGYCGNDPQTGGHAWNLVKVDGKWYQLDTTWNDGDSSDQFFLVTDDFMSLSRTWDRGKYPPSAKQAYTVK